MSGDAYADGTRANRPQYETSAGPWSSKSGAFAFLNRAASSGRCHRRNSPHLTASRTPLPATIVALVLPFLSARDQVSLQLTHSSFPGLWGDTCIFPPGTGTYRRRRFGFGKLSPLLSTSHSGEPSPYLLFHLAWSWLTVPDRRIAAEALPLLRQYAQLCRAAVHLDLSSLHAARPPATDSTPICTDRAYHMAAALLRTGFHYKALCVGLAGIYRSTAQLGLDIQHCRQCSNGNYPAWLPGY